MLSIKTEESMLLGKIAAKVAFDLLGLKLFTKPQSVLLLASKSGFLSWTLVVMEERDRGKNVSINMY